MPEFRWPTTPLTLASTSLLATDGALLRIAGVVFGEQLELGLLAADGDALGVQLVDGHAGAVLVVLAEVGDAAAGRADVADLDDQVLRRNGAGEDRCGRRRDQVQFDLHANTSGIEMNRFGIFSPETHDDNAIAGPGRIGTFIDNRAAAGAIGSAIFAFAQLACDRADDDVAHRRGEFLARVAHQGVGGARQDRRSASRRRTSSISSTWRCRSARTRWVICISLGVSAAAFGVAVAPVRAVAGASSTGAARRAAQRDGAGALAAAGALAGATRRASTALRQVVPRSASALLLPVPAQVPARRLVRSAPVRPRPPATAWRGCRRRPRRRAGAGRHRRRGRRGGGIARPRDDLGQRRDRPRRRPARAHAATSCFLIG